MSVHFSTEPSALPRDAPLRPAPALPGDPFGIYIHIPFCAHICPYCDFNTYAGQSDRVPEYVAAVCRETTMWSPLFAGRQAASIFFGGGTPSQLAAGQVEAIVSACRTSFEVGHNAEITLEANPNDLSEQYCSELCEAGINRISIGAQTLDRRGLRVLGRLHEAEHIAQAVAAARAGGFGNLSLDLIYAWPGQTLDSWRSDLERILVGEIGGSAPDHLSLYELIVEPGTPMADAVARNILTPTDPDTAADLTELAASVLAEAGWHHYEIANWAADRALTSRHNAIYWRNGEYAGIGAGAHGYVGGQRTMNQPSPRRYVASVMGGNSPVSNVDIIDTDTAMSETMMLGLRLVQEGVSVEAFRARHGVVITDQFGVVIQRLAGQGLLETHAGRVRLTNRGSLLANSVCAEFL